MSASRDGTRRLGWALWLAALWLAAPSCSRSSGASIEDPSEDPAPASEHERLCAHDYEILIVPTGAGSPGVRETFMASCEANAASKREAMGEAAWTARVECMLASDTAEALGRCDGREPRAPEQVSAPEVSLAEVCDQVLRIMIAEVGPGVIDERELPEFRKHCMKEFEQDYAADPVGFARQARCIMESNDLGELSLCEGR